MRKLVLISISLNVIILGIFLFSYFSGPVKKIGIVRMEKVVYEYEGMKDATKAYEKKTGQWKKDSDSLEIILRTLYNEMKADSVSGNTAKLKQDLRLFYLYRNSYVELNQNIEQKTQETDTEMTSSVITQLNAHMADYAKEKGYDLILCNNPQYQAIGYSKDSYDVSGEFLEYANQRYNGTVK